MNNSTTALEQYSVQPADTRTISRGFLIELVGNMVVFIICTLVCLQIFAAAQSILDRSRAVSTLGQESVSMIEGWKSGSNLAELSQRFGGEVDGDELTVYFDRDCQPIADGSTARYRLSFSVDAQSNGYDSGHLLLTMGDEVLLEWSVGRYRASSLGGR